MPDRIEFGERRRQIGRERRDLPAAGSLAQRRQQERVEPDDEAAGQTGDDAVAMGAAPVEPEHQPGREVGDGAEADQADRGERQIARDDAFVGVTGHQDDHDRSPSHEDHERAHVARHAGLAPQEIGHDQLIADHAGKRHAGHDDHRRRRRQAADENESRQPALAVGQRQLQDIEIGVGLRAEQQQAGGRDRHDEQVDQHQVEREQPTRRPEAGRMIVLDHGDVELARKAKKGHRRQQRGDRPSERRALATDPVGNGRNALDLGQQVGRPAEQHEQHERADGEKRQQLDHRFEGDRQHHAAVLL